MRVNEIPRDPELWELCFAEVKSNHRTYSIDELFNLTAKLYEYQHLELLRPGEPYKQTTPRECSNFRAKYYKQ